MPKIEPSLGSGVERGAMAYALATVTVTYNPDISILKGQLGELPDDSLKVLVDNGSSSELVEELRMLVSARSDIRLIENPENVGLASALNQGVGHARLLGRAFVLLLDQDTEPLPGSVEKLMSAYRLLGASMTNLGCVGPALVDQTTGLPHGFHVFSKWQWKRSYPLSAATEPLPLISLNGSGTLVSVSVFEAVGGLDSELFIDHVDTDWSFRVLDAGYRLFGIPEACFKQRMGVKGIRYWLLGWRVWPYRSARRHYYLFRNTLRLLRKPSPPLVWKVLAPVKLALTLTVHLIFDPARSEQFREMVRGVRDGVVRTGRAGR